MRMFQGKKILLGVTGSIAAYKSLLLVRLLVKEGASVKVIQTPSSRDFVTPLSLATLSKNETLSEIFQGDTWANHVEWGRWADLMLIAPLSCNTLAKMAQGLCDNLLLATYLSATCPVVVVPAMDEDMWRHPATQANLQRLLGFGNRVIPVERGELASGLYGEGRMAEPEAILAYLRDNFFLTGRMQKGQRDLEGKKALVTAGPTYEAIDPVRYISNHSSGKMGIAIAIELAERGAQVDLVLGPTSLAVDIPGVTVRRVVSAEDMYKASLESWAHADMAIMAAAVADYTPVVKSLEKIKKKEEALVLQLARTPDILRTLGSHKKKGQVLVGFALETSGGKAYALDKLRTKNADLIVLNSLADEGAGFGFDTNRVTIFDRNGGEITFERKPKQQVAKDIVDRAVKWLYA
jgi:phosphopantothenoylcysteine decarboxylase/phosphopantothenate--cysteine ligase